MIIKSIEAEATVTCERQSRVLTGAITERQYIRIKSFVNGGKII